MGVEATDDAPFGSRAQGGSRTRQELLELARRDLRLSEVGRGALERLRHELILALSLERDRRTRELLPNPLSRDEFEELDELHGRVDAWLAGH